MTTGIGGSGSALISSSLAIPVIGGLVTSTFLTLLVVPVGYSLLRGRRQKGKAGSAVVVMDEDSSVATTRGNAPSK